MDIASQKTKDCRLDLSILYGRITLLAVRKSPNPKKEIKVLGLD
jgi:hypothetical protein